jgi:two-component system, LytTR family, sensor kinase
MTSDRLKTSHVVALALVVGVFFTAEEVFMDLAGQRPQLAARDILTGTVFWLVWAALTPIALAAVRRWPLDRQPAYRSVLANLLVAIALSTVHNLIASGMQYFVSHPTATAATALRAAASGTPFVWGLFTGVVFYAVMVMVVTATRFRRLYAAGQLQAAALKQELTQSKLDTLRAQLRPHFLFNTLNAISVLVKEDGDAAQQMILRLSTLLRRSLDEEAHEVPLRSELTFVSDYLDIQRGRFGDRLSIDLSIDPLALDAMVPVFLLQPLLENAIEHGRAEDGCTVALRIVRETDQLHIALTDDGPGIDETEARERVGLSNTRERLHHLYGERASVDLTTARLSASSPGTRVQIRIPLRVVAA